MPGPKNIKYLRQVLGFIGWYSRFIKNDVDRKNPLVKLLRKATPWEWDPEQEETFQGLKQALTDALVLPGPNFSKTFTVHPDSSEYEIRAVVTQEHEDGEHPIVFISKLLTPVKINYSTIEREMLAIIVC